MEHTTGTVLSSFISAEGVDASITNLADVIAEKVTEYSFLSVKTDFLTQTALIDSLGYDAKPTTVKDRIKLFYRIMKNAHLIETGKSGMDCYHPVAVQFLSGYEELRQTFGIKPSDFIAKWEVIVKSNVLSERKRVTLDSIATSLETLTMNVGSLTKQAHDQKLLLEENNSTTVSKSIEDLKQLNADTREMVARQNEEAIDKIAESSDKLDSIANNMSVQNASTTQTLQEILELVRQQPSKTDDLEKQIEEYKNKLDKVTKAFTECISRTEEEINLMDQDLSNINGLFSINKLKIANTEHLTKIKGYLSDTKQKIGE